MELIVFTNNGKTFIFDDVSNFKHETSGFSFDYVGKSTGVGRKANFDYTSVAGYSTNYSDKNNELLKALKAWPYNDPRLKNHDL